jgi:hypothetical protein
LEIFSKGITLDIQSTTLPPRIFIEGGIREFLDCTEIDESGQDYFWRWF